LSLARGVLWLLLVSSSLLALFRPCCASSFSFQQPKENGTKRKGRPTSLKALHSDVILRAGSTRHPWLKRTYSAHPVRYTRKITPPIGSEERGIWSYSKVSASYLF